MNPPAFQLYADNFVSGTLDMSREERGDYIILLCYQWSKGSIPSDKKKLARIVGGEVSADVLAKFEWTETGGRNKRLEAVRAEQAAYRAKQSENAKARWRKNAVAMPPHMPPQCHGNATAYPVAMPVDMPNGMPNACSPSPSPTPNKTDINKEYNKGYMGPKGPRVRFEPPKREELDAEAETMGLPSIEVDKFVAYYASNGWKVGKNPMKSWKHALAGWAHRWKDNQAARSAPRLFDNRYGTDTPADAPF